MTTAFGKRQDLDGLSPGGATSTTPTGADRALAALRLLAEFPNGAALHEVASALNAPKASAHRSLGVLRKAELVEQDTTGRYRLSWDFVQLAFRYYEGIDLIARVRPCLVALSEHFGETAHYAVLEGGEIVYLAKEQSSKARFHLTSLVGGRNPAHCTGIGKVLLAYTLTSSDAVEDFVERHGPLARRTEHTLVTAAALSAEFEQIRAARVGFDREESEYGVHCLALPIFLTSTERPDGAVSLTAVGQRVPIEDLASSTEVARDLVRTHLPLADWASPTRGSTP